MAKIVLPAGYAVTVLTPTGDSVMLAAESPSKAKWRSVVVPDDDVSELPPDVQKVLADLWTPERLAAYTQSLPVEPPITIETLKEAAAEQRRKVLRAPAMTAYGRCWCDQGTRSDLGQVVQMIDEGLMTEPVPFKLVDGGVALTRADVLLVASAVCTRVTAAFAVEDRLCRAIDAKTVTTLHDIVTAEWPS